MSVWIYKYRAKAHCVSRMYMRGWVFVNYVAYLGAVVLVIITKLMTAPGANTKNNFILDMLNGANAVGPI